METIETVNDETIEPGDWISWRREKIEEKRRFGKVIENSGKLFILCQKDSSARGIVPDSWGMSDFEWAVAEGRVPATSIWTVEDKLMKHEKRYISSSGRSGGLETEG